jgi:alkanesulfonate monooxygenase SsuD/methylene tetrahydromethanopterin reductase-like flavin-dependent oxidoreductase (luciferase family)
VYISLCLDARRPWTELLELARRADQAELHAIYVPDHFGIFREAWTLLSAVAACTERVRLGTLVLGVTHRPVPLVLEMARSLDEVSGGRLVLGLGAAWDEVEHRSLALPFPTLGDRMTLLESACRRLTDAGPPPLLVGGGGERRTMPIAARHASVWHAWAEPEAFQRKCEVMDQLCRGAGRDPSSVRRATGAVILDEKDTAATLAAYQDAGADEFVVRDHHQASVAESFAAVLQAT